MIVGTYSFFAEYPKMDAKVTEKELYEIIGIGLKCFGWTINIKEEE